MRFKKVLDNKKEIISLISNFRMEKRISFSINILTYVSLFSFSFCSLVYMDSTYLFYLSLILTFITTVIKIVNLKNMKDNVFNKANIFFSKFQNKKITKKLKKYNEDSLNIFKIIDLDIIKNESFDSNTAYYFLLISEIKNASAEELLHNREKFLEIINNSFREVDKNGLYEKFKKAINDNIHTEKEELDQLAKDYFSIKEQIKMKQSMVKEI